MFSHIFKASALWADAVHMCVCLCECLAVCLFTFQVPFKRLFTPTSQSQMFKNFRDLESLGKSNGNKWSHIQKKKKRLQIQGRAKKKVGSWANFALLSRFFLVSVFLTRFNGLFAPTSRSRLSKLFRFSESLGKSNGNKWSQI